MDRAVPEPHGGEPLRVLRLSPAIYREGTWPIAFDPVGGLQIQVWRITEQLSKLGLKQTVLTTHIPGSPRQSKPFPGTVIRSVGPWLPQIMGRWFMNFGWFLGVLPELLFRARNYDIAHVHLNHSVWCRAVVLVAAMRGLPTVASMNTALWGIFTDAMVRRGIPFGLPARIERLALTSAERVLALTESDAVAKAREMRIDRSHFEVVPDAIDAGWFAPSDGPAETAARFRSTYHIPADAMVIAYVGRISMEKGWPDLPRIFSRLANPRAFLLVCGDGRDRDKLASALEDLKRPGSWCITGFLSPDDVRTALSVSDVLVLPSRREAFGGVLLEAMASDLPAVAYRVGGISEVAGQPNAVQLVDAGDVEGLAASVEVIGSNEALRSALVARGRDRVRDFSIHRIGDATLAVYRAVSKRRRRAGSAALEPRSP